MKPFGLKYRKINMYSNFCMLYYSEYVDFTECRTCLHAQYKCNSSKGKTFIAFKKSI